MKNITAMYLIHNYSLLHTHSQVPVEYFFLTQPMLLPKTDDIITSKVQSGRENDLLVFIKDRQSKLSIRIRNCPGTPTSNDRG